MVEWRGGWRGQREMRQRLGLWWGSEGSHMETEIHFLCDKCGLAGYTCQMLQGFGRMGWDGMGCGEKANTTAREPPPGASGYSS